jgi:transglutaminase-like putative cysteine protease
VTKIGIEPIMEEYLKDTLFLDYKDSKFDTFLKDIDTAQHRKQIALDLYFLVRDAFLYDPYHLDLTPVGLKASEVLNKKRAWCVEKSAVLTAAGRRFGIPTRLGYAIVKNHIGVEKLMHYLRREEIVFHGYVEMFLNDKWVKCTPAFDQRICRISGVSPLEWDGVNDSLFQEFDRGNKFMEYLHFYGYFSDVPIKLMNDEMKKYYPHLFEKHYESKEFSFKHL